MIRFFTSHPEQFNEWRWIWSSSWSTTSLWLLAAMLGVALYWSWRTSVRLPTLGRKVGLLFLRLTGATLLWLLLAGPAIELRHVQKIQNYLPILIDTSASMKIRTGSQGPTRIELVRSFFQKHRSWIETLRNDHKVQMYTFDREVQEFDGNIERLDATGDQTNLLRVGQFLQEHFKDRPLAGVLLVTDGIDTLARTESRQGNISKRVNVREEKQRTGQRQQGFVLSMQQLQVPVHVLAPPQQKERKDIAVSDIYGDAFAFLHNKATIEARIQATGYPGLQVPVSLYQEGQLLQTKMLFFQTRRVNTLLSFEFRPNRAGQFVYSVRIPPQRGEALVENNQKAFVLKIIRDRIRVLQLTGRPSWDVRFLRRLLKKNASVDLISFFILRTHYNEQPVPQNEMALIPFPAKQLFTTRLQSFDLVIFQNFNYGPYLPKGYLNNIEQFVRKGGAFMMLGGDLSFGKGGYLNTAVERLLPIKLDLGQIHETPFRPVLTGAGKHHPITQLLADPGGNEGMWKNFPLLEGVNVVGDVLPRGTVLLQHPTLRTESGQPVPVLAVGQYGKGRALTLTVDDSWRWNFEQIGQGGTQAPYYRFWNNAIRWLIRDPELERVRISSYRSSYRWGEHARFRIRLFNQDYRPQTQGKVTIIIQRTGEERVLEKAVRPIEADGSIAYDWQPKKPGTYRIKVSAEDGKRAEIEGDSLFEVRGLHDEFLQIHPNESLFRELQKKTGSQIVRLDEEIKSLPFRAPTILRIHRSQTVDLWDNVFVLLFFFGIFGLEWFLRRRWGLA